MESDQEQARMVRCIPWRWICLAVGLVVGAFFLWDVISHPVYYFGYDPFPAIKRVFIPLFWFTVAAAVFACFLILVDKIPSKAGPEREEPSIEVSPQEPTVHSLFQETRKPRRWSDDYPCDVVGESRYQKALDEICGGKDFDGHSEEVTATLVLDDGNPYDNQAVRVEIEGETVGYLSRENARKFRKRYAKKKPVRCCAIILGGWDRGDGDTGQYGVKLDLKL